MTEQPVGPRCGNNPNFQMSDGDRKAVDDFKARLALQASAKPYIDSAAWADGDPLMEVIAATLWKHCARDDEDMPQLVCDDPRTIAAFAAAVARAHAAGPVAVPPTDQTALRDRTAAAPVKQRADCTETEWAEQERARFERLYTRESVRADTAVRDADIYQARLERLGEGYTRERKRAERAEAEAERLRTYRDATCICQHTEQQHFEDACLVCDCGDYLPPEAAREVIARWRTAALNARADRAAVLTEVADFVRGLLLTRTLVTTVSLEAELRRMADEAQQQECSASISGRCLREAESETACDTEAGECVHGRRPGAEAQQQPDTEPEFTEARAAFMQIGRTPSLEGLRAELRIEGWPPIVGRYTGASMGRMHDVPGYEHLLAVDPRLVFEYADEQPAAVSQPGKEA